MDSRSLLERELDDAIRTGLRDAGVHGVLAPHVATMMGLILNVLKRHEPTVDEVVEDVRSRNGFLRAGDDAVLGDGRHASPRLLTDALLRLWREERAMDDPRAGEDMTEKPPFHD